MNKKIKYQYYIEQDKDENANYISSWSIYKKPMVKTIKVKSFKSLNDADIFFHKYESN